MEQQPTDPTSSRKPRVYKICVTGGPCAGKTTSLSILKEKFSQFQVYILPELAATTFGAGVTIIPSEFTPEDHVVFTGGIMQMQLQLEDYFTKIAKIQKTDVIILCDRGVMDNTAYCTKETEEKVYEHYGWNKTDIRDNRYDMVLHLVTAANGAEEYYTLENNQARSESAEVARELDIKTQSVWSGHPNHIIVDNNVSSFAEKTDVAYKHICQMLGVNEIPSYNRKFLLKNEVTLSQIPDNMGAEEFKQVFTFLNTSKEGHVSWVCKRTALNGSAYLGYVDRKIASNESERIELRRKVQPTLYGEYLKIRDPKRNDLEKMTISFVFNSHRYSIESTVKGGKKISLVRVYVPKATEEVNFPDFLEIGEEITEEKRYHTYNLADPNFA